MTNIITIDGPSGVGKGTVSLKIAKHLGWNILDSGALYRILALIAKRNQISVKDENQLVKLANELDIEFIPSDDLSKLQIIYAKQDITSEIRNEIYGSMASQIAVNAKIRTALLARQRAFYILPGLVADGRDMGTVVFPEAKYKFFLTASCEERALRRYKQLINIGIYVRLSELALEIANRDKRDSMRTTAPLVAAPDAITIDTTELSIEEVVEQILNKMVL
ncbi:(d)CMP kinase [Candidatus Halobeggiatoa sp. HSG11]|nr:(d)CMP kinase [Candidatus Halobeggiatoa sp. HSG11]